MRFLLPLIVVCTVPYPGWGQEVTLPAEVKSEPGMLFVKAKTDSPSVLWWAPDGGLQLIPSDLLKDSKTAVAFAMRPGKYRLQAVVAKGDKAAAAVCLVIVGNPGPDPDPEPEPKPKPKPEPEPIPDTALVKALKVAWAQESLADKALMPTLITYAQTAASYADDERLTLVKEVADLMKATREKLIGTALPKVRAVVSAELQQVLPVAVGFPLGAAGSETRQKIKNKLLEVASALKEVK